ncbi:MAG: hypothetical protein ACXWB9_04860 [Flavisolibacter sp.]
MINPSELRLGNLVLYKTGTRIIPVPVDFSHMEIMGKGDVASFFPVLLKPEWFEKAGFVENKKYALLPDAREFICALPVQGNQENEIYGYMKNNKECFARATVNKVPISGNIFHVHGLQNLYHALTGEEMKIKQ